MSVNELHSDVIIVNIYFAHYRFALIHHLLHSQHFSYTLCAETYDVSKSGVKVWIPEDVDGFIRLPTFRIMNRYYFQCGVMRLAFNRSCRAIVYSGDAQHLSTWMSASIARLSGKRVLFWTHGWHRDERGLKAFIRNSFYRLANGLLLYGERAKSIGIRKGFPAESLYVIYNSLDSVQQKVLRERVTETEIRATRAELFDNPRRPVVICSGRLTKLRGVDLLLGAMALLKQHNHEVNAVIVGNGPERRLLAQMAAELSLSVIFCGECYEEVQLCRLFMAANVTVSPGVAGLLVIHSLVYGTPVITHDCLEEQGPEVEAIRRGINGDLFRKGDVQALAEAIEAWTQTEFVDEELRGECQRTIDAFYNADFQRTVIERAISGLPAR